MEELEEIKEKALLTEEEIDAVWDECMPYPLTGSYDLLCSSIREAIEASAQRGAKKVVDWINDNPIYIQSNSLGIKVPIQTEPVYDAFLKTLGVQLNDKKCQ